MSELYNIINEFDIRMTDNEEDTENTGLDFEKEFGPARHGKSMKGAYVNGQDDIEGIESSENGEMSFDGDNDFGMNYDSEDPEDSDSGADYDSEEDDIFAGEKRTDITHKLKQILQNRGMDFKSGEDEEGNEELPDLDDLDFDLSTDSDYEEDDEDPDFDYSVFSDARDSDPKSDKEDKEFNFDK